MNGTTQAAILARPDRGRTRPAFKCATSGLATAAVASASLAGCATVASSYATDRAAPSHAVGAVYDLPVKTMSVAVGSNRFGLFVSVQDIRVEGDASASYVLAYRHDSSSADTFDLAVDPTTGLLSTVKVEADSKAAETITALAHSAGQIAGLFESQRTGAIRIYAIRPLTYWSTAATTRAEADRQLAQLNADINAIVHDVVAVQGCRMQNASVLADDLRATTCAGSQLVPGKVPSVQLAIDYTPFRSSIGAPDCSIGVCTRHQSTAAMTLSTVGSHDFARVPLPNGSAPVPLPLRRAAFTKATTEYTLVDGLLSKAAFAKGAELPAAFAAIGSLPGQFIGGIVGGVTQAGNLRKARTDADASRRANEKDPDAAPAGQFELNKPGQTETSFEAGLVMIVYPLPQPDTSLPALKASPQSPGEATESLAPEGGRTTAPGPASPAEPEGN